MFVSTVSDFELGRLGILLIHVLIRKRDQSREVDLNAVLEFGFELKLALELELALGLVGLKNDVAEHINLPIRALPTCSCPSSSPPTLAWTKLGTVACKNVRARSCAG